MTYPTKVSDIAHHHSTAFHHWTLAPDQHYGWHSDFKAHSIAVRVCQDAVWFDKVTQLYVAVSSRTQPYAAVR